MAISHSARSSFRQQHPKEYQAWKAMRNRCYNPTNPSWKYYGAKGIGVCDRWRESFAAFLEDMGPAPGPEYSLERERNEIGYEPGNVRWATASEQQHNTSKCNWIEWNGRRMLGVDWAKETGISATTIRTRIDRFKWSVEKALTTPPFGTMNGPRRRERPPVKNSKRAVTYNGETFTVPYWAQRFGISAAAMYYRLRLGWTIDQIREHYTGLHPIDQN